MAAISLFMILIIRIVNEWQQKSLGYFYGFQGAGELAGNPKYELSTAFPQMDSYYGFLSGFAYTVPYSIFGLFAGVLTRGK
jgi:hypothetical protein